MVVPRLASRSVGRGALRSGRGLCELCHRLRRPWGRSRAPGPIGRRAERRAPRGARMPGDELGLLLHQLAIAARRSTMKRQNLWHVLAKSCPCWVLAGTLFVVMSFPDPVRAIVIAGATPPDFT